MSSPYGLAASKSVLTSYKRWAMVGASNSPFRASHGVMRFLLDHGFEVVPVNPTQREVLGRRCYPDLASIPSEEDIEVVDIFRRADQAGVHVDEAIAIGAKAVWMQIGVIDEDAARRAAEAGLEVVMDRCPKIDLPQLPLR